MRSHWVEWAPNPKSWNNTMAPAASKPPTSAGSSLPLPLQVCLSAQDMNHSVCVSLFPVPHHMYAYHNRAQLPVFSLQGPGQAIQGDMWVSSSRSILMGLGRVTVLFFFLGGDVFGFVCLLSLPPGASYDLLKESCCPVFLIFLKIL